MDKKDRVLWPRGPDEKSTPTRWGENLTRSYIGSGSFIRTLAEVKIPSQQTIKLSNERVDMLMYPKFQAIEIVNKKILFFH